MDSSQTVTRFVGICQICEGQFKLDAQALMVHHGYKRPGGGYIVGDCAAVGHPAYEQSCERLKLYIVGMRAALATAQARKCALESGEVSELTVESRYRRGYAAETRTHKVGDVEWLRVLESAIGKQTQLVRWLTDDIKRCEARVAAWKAQPLRTVEELRATERASAQEAQAAKLAKRQAKLDAKIKGYQTRIDAACRRKTTSTLADIFESAPAKLREIVGWNELTAAQALALLERDHVWRAFELEPGAPSNQVTLSKMSWPALHGLPRFPWPAGL
jgi:cell division protein FtsB